MRRNPVGSVSSPGAARAAALPPRRFGLAKSLLHATQGGALHAGAGRNKSGLHAAIKCVAARRPPGLLVLAAGAGIAAQNVRATAAAEQRRSRAGSWPGTGGLTEGRGSPRTGQDQSPARS